MKIACLGSGLIGHSWATLFSIKGHQVILQDIAENILEEAVHRIEANLDLLAEKSVINNTLSKSAIGKISTTMSIQKAVCDADFVQESTLETYSVKRAVFKEADSAAPEDTILASSSTGLLMTEIQKATSRPERCIIAHPYNPPHLIPLVELVPGEATNKRTVKRAFQFFESLGKVPIVAKKEVSGYIANRIQWTLMRAADDVVNSGIASVEDVDRALSTGPGIRWAIYGPYLTMYFNTPSHISRRQQSEMVSDGMKKYNLLKGKSFDDMVRWRDSTLIDILRVLELIPMNKTRE